MLQGWKTVIFGIAVALTAVFSNLEVQTFVAAYLPWVGGFLGAAVVGLRALTNSSIFKPPV